MYTYTGSMLRPNIKNAEYQTDIPGTITMRALFQGYSDGYLTFTNPDLTGTVYVDFNALKTANLPFRNLTLNDWLGSIGRSALPQLSVPPVYTTTSIRYQDAWESGYTFSRIARLYPDATGLSTQSMESVYMSKTSTDVGLLHGNALTTVNGLLHLNIPHNDGLIITQAGASADIALANRVGLISFASVGTVSQIPITPEMFEPAPEIDPTACVVFLNTGIDMRNKSLLLSLGGYMHVNDTTYTVVNAEIGLIRIDFQQFDTVRRVLDSKHLIDMSTLYDAPPTQYVDVVSPITLSTRDFMMSYLLLPQSFMILVDVPEIHSKRHPLASTKLYGLYCTATPPQWPFIDTYGKFPEYWCRREFDMYTLKIDGGVQQDYLYTTADWRADPAVNPITTPDGYRLAQGQLLEISSTVWSNRP